MNKTLITARLYTRFRNVPRRCYTESPPSPLETTSMPNKSSELNVPGLSERVLKIASSAVGPGASKSSDYKNPEYFSYDKTSYFEAEIEMLKFRLPQPSSLKN